MCIRRYFVSILLAILASIMAPICMALPAKQVVLPFRDVPLFSRNYHGLVFLYDLNAKGERNVVCELANSYKSYFVYHQKGRKVESETYGGNQQITLTKNQKMRRNGENLVLHTDSVGLAQIMGLKLGVHSNTTVSCQYVAMLG